MASENEKIIGSLRRLMYQDTKSNFYLVDVISVDINENTCDGTTMLADGNVSIQGIHLSTQNNDGLILIPALGSTVLVLRNTQNNEYYMICSEDLSDIYIHTSNNVNLSSSNTVVLQNTNHGGLVKITELVDKLNNIEKAYNNLLNNMRTAFVPVSDLSSVMGVLNAISTLLIPMNTLYPLSQITDLENPDVKHGNK